MFTGKKYAQLIFKVNNNSVSAGDNWQCFFYSDFYETH